MSKHIEKLLPVEMEVPRAVKRGLILAGLLLVFGIYVVFIHPVRMLPLRIGEVVQNVIPTIITLIILPLYLKFIVMPPKKPVTLDDSLLAAARSLADRLGVKICEVRILEGDYGMRHPLAWVKFKGKIIYITRKLVDVLSEEEMSWVLAHELAHLKTERLGRLKAAMKFTWLMALLPALFLINLFYVFYVSGSIASLVIVYGVPIVAEIIFIAMSLPIERRIEYEADLIALETTENHEKELLEDHPKVSNRVRMLKKAAEEMGI
ncbi:MAG: M48 family metalloprotease [Armatimonadota bacterium]